MLAQYNLQTVVPSMVFIKPIQLPTEKSIIRML